ncbi:hypothetical protein CT676_35630 [Bradyrhizobium sp. MOS001]|nr:hypothetical protein CT676_35630 [Bradyrhizobium sp. MOS001]
MLLFCSGLSHTRHCEERSDEAIQTVSAETSLDCFASLAMTISISSPAGSATAPATGTPRCRARWRAACSRPSGPWTPTAS